MMVPVVGNHILPMPREASLLATRLASTPAATASSKIPSAKLQAALANVV